MKRSNSIVILLFLTMISHDTLNAQSMEKESIKHSPVCAFPLGDKLPDIYSKYFIGQAYLAPLTHMTELHVPKIGRAHV